MNNKELVFVGGYQIEVIKKFTGGVAATILNTNHIFNFNNWSDFVKVANGVTDGLQPQDFVEYFKKFSR